MALSEKTLFSGRGWELKLLPYAEPAVEQLLANTVWGTKGGVRYQHREGLAKVQALKDTSYLTLRHHAELIGTLGLVQKSVRINGQPYAGRAYYVRYLSMIEGLQTQTETGKRKKKEHPGRNPGLGLLRGSLTRLFADQAYWAAAGGDPDLPTIFYAYVIIDNERSANLVANYGFQTFGKFKTRVFSRLFPKRQAQVRRLRPEEIPAMAARLAAHYQPEGLVATDSMKIEAPYFVYEENGAILAGVQAQRVHWVIQELPGWGGKLVRNVLPYLPLVSRVFNPRDFHFAALDGLYLPENSEQILPKLLEHLCAELETHVALMWADVSDPHFQQIEAMPAKGLLSPLVEGTGSVHLMVRTNEADPSEVVAQLARGPHYISVEDVT